MLKYLFIPRRPTRLEAATRPRPEVLVMQQRIAELEGICASIEAAAQMYSEENVLLRQQLAALHTHVDDLMRCGSILKARQYHMAYKALLQEQETDPLNPVSETPMPGEQGE